MSQIYPIYLRKYNQSNWQLIGRYIKPDNLPKSNDRYDTDLLQFSLSFIGLKDSNGNLIIIEDGDDIVVLNNHNKTSVFNNMCGTVIRLSATPNYKRTYNGFEYTLNTIIEYDLTIEQRDYSLAANDIYQTTSINIDELLDVILKGSRDDLGGTLPSGLYIPKYLIISEIVTIPNIELLGKQKEQVKQLLSTVGLTSRLEYYSEPDTTNTLKVIQQILIYKQ